MGDYGFTDDELAALGSLGQTMEWAKSEEVRKEAKIILDLVDRLAEQAKNGGQANG